MRMAIRDLLIIISTSAALIVAARSFSNLWEGAPDEPHHLVVASQEPSPPPHDPSVLRVCADPNNLPFSNAQQRGFENELAQIVANALGRRLEYYWQPQRRGFIRTTLNAGWCDLVMGLPSRTEMARTTRPYYRSSYVFVSRRNGAAPIRSLDDPRLREIRIGVEMTGEDYENPPAVQALASRRIIDNLRPYLVYGDYSQADPPRRIVDAVAAGDVDTAIAWGPLAGYFAAHSRVPLELAPVTPERDGPGLSFAFDISMGVRRKDQALSQALDRVITDRARQIEDVLKRFNIPTLMRGEPS
jgi:mxaJ protein